MASRGRRSGRSGLGLALGLALGVAGAAAGEAPCEPPSCPPLAGEAPCEPPSCPPLAVEGLGEAAPAPAEPAPPELKSEEEAEELALELDGEPASEAGDPLEPLNRAFFGANRIFDRFVIEPLARSYGWLVPEPGKRAVVRLFENLNAPVVFVNDLLQLEPGRAGRTGARFLVNTTAGLAGFFDVAVHCGLAGHSADFGQTLGRHGVAPGAYLVLPLLGPSTLRDAVGQLVDTALRPDTWLLSPGGRLVLATTGGVAQREEHLVELVELERSSVDFYATLRSAYLMSRARAIREQGD